MSFSTENLASASVAMSTTACCMSSDMSTFLMMALGAANAEASVPGAGAEVEAASGLVSDMLGTVLYGRVR